MYDTKDFLYSPKDFHMLLFLNRISDFLINLILIFNASYKIPFTYGILIKLKQNDSDIF